MVNYASSKAGADKVVSKITAAGGAAVAVGGDVTKAAEAQGKSMPQSRTMDVSTSSSTTPAGTSSLPSRP